MRQYHVSVGLAKRFALLRVHWVGGGEPAAGEGEQEENRVFTEDFV